MSEYPKHIENIKYGDEHRFQNLDICLPKRLETVSDDAVWIV